MIRTILYLISFFLLICALILLVSKKRTPAEIILIIWQILLSTVYALQIFQWEITMAFSNSIFVYLYTRCMLVGNKFYKKDLLFFIPSAIYAISTIFYPDAIYNEALLIYTILILWLGIFFWKAIRLVLDYKKGIEKNSIQDSKPNLKWVIAVICVAITCHFIKILPAIIYYIEGTRLNTVVINTIMLSLLLIGGLIGIRFDLLFIEKEDDKEIKTDPYSTYNLKDDEINVVMRQLGILMENERLFLKHDLSLKELAERLNISTNYLSFVLNTKLSQNFYELINNYRLDEVKKQLLDPKKKHLSIIGIANDCGFKSQTTFNRVFKQREGISPSVYQEQNIGVVTEREMVISN